MLAFGFGFVFPAIEGKERAEAEAGAVVNLALIKVIFKKNTLVIYLFYILKWSNEKYLCNSFA